MARRPFDLAGHRLPPIAVAVCAGIGAWTAALVLVGDARQAWASIQAPGPAGVEDGILLVGCAVGAALAAWLGVGLVLAALATLPGVVGACAQALADRLAPPAIRKGVAFLLGTTLTAGLAPGTAVAATSSSVSGLPAAQVSSSALVGRQPASSQGGAAGPATGQSAPAALPDPSFGAAATGGQSAPAALPDPSFGAAAQPVPSAAASHAAGPGAAGPAAAGPGAARPGAARPGAAVSTPSRPVVRHSVGVAPDPSWLPERPREPRPHLPAPIDLLSRAASPGRSVDDHVAVRRGDTLWSIAARHLGPSASNAEIAGEWPRWFEANRALIGDDANLLQPGQLLRPPSSTRGAS